MALISLAGALGFSLVARVFVGWMLDDTSFVASGAGCVNPGVELCSDGCGAATGAVRVVSINRPAFGKFVAIRLRRERCGAGAWLVAGSVLGAVCGRFGWERVRSGRTLS